MNKKNTILLTLALFVVTFLPAIEWDIVDFCAYSLGIGEKINYTTTVWKQGNELTLIRNINNEDYYQKLSVNDLQLKPDGFYELEAFGSKLVVLFGAQYFFFHDITRPEYSMYNTKIDYNKFYKETESIFNYEWGRIGRRLKNFANITVPDVLEETGKSGKIRYDTSDMLKYYARGSDGWVLANPYGKPWATSKNPIGMTIDIEFTNEVNGLGWGILKGGSDYLIILNGYANPLKRYLYKENRRIKRLKIESLDAKAPFALEQELEDVVRFHVVKFPRIAKKIRLTILDFYEGSKYQDLCVQAFLCDYDMAADSGESFVQSSKPWKP